MNEHGRKRATIVAAAVLVYASLVTNAALAETVRQNPIGASVPQNAPTAAIPAVDAASAVPAPSLDRPLRTVTFLMDGAASAYPTSASTVGEFLAERGIVPTTQDAVSVPLAHAIRAGMDVSFRRAVPLTIVDGRSTRTLRSNAPLVRDVLATNGYRIRPSDEVAPPAGTPVVSGETIRVVRVKTWTTNVRESLPVRVRTHFDRDLAFGTTRTESNGRAGIREITTSYERRGEISHETSLISRIVRQPQDRVIAHGIGRFASLAHIARTGFAATVTLAGQALSMIATAYTAACYGCSGVTASGQRAGHGIVAVDPSVIPLGTRLFIPGYGRAIAGDTGGAIVGHRIDLGFDREGDALQFGRRPITVYVLKK